MDDDEPPPYPGVEDAPPPYSTVTSHITLQDGCPSTPPPPYPGTKPWFVRPPYILQQPPPGSQNRLPPHAAQRHPAVITQPVGIVVTRFTDRPVRTRCPHCQEVVETWLEYRTGAMAWFICILLFLFGVWPCCVLPLCVDSYKDVIHLCPYCHSKLGSFRRM
ncbi:lipopolysaccharide-induced tumor necrosis factor-alpha factor homolog [Ptychodera flava]|uniref:lipopolysaccharide-induced tumor necrosis factor-alpha factor homolog n=1 Tax=Ptychodera flava TaxID=63121 RepID=UPI00396A2B8B